MKKSYVTPDVEKVAFQYRDQVVVASGGSCTEHYLSNQDKVNENCSPNGWSGDNTPKI